jgi:cell division septation protein DedD
MAENRRGKDNRMYFSRGQIILLGAAFTVASLVIFVLGVFVGQGIEGRKLMKKEEPLVRIPVKPTAQEPGAVSSPPKNEITFDSLPRPGAALASADEAPKAKAAERVASVENKGPQNTAPKAIAAKASEKKLDKPAPAVKKPESPANPETREQNNGWRAQVNAFPDERSAKVIVDRLKDKGYNAYVTEVQNRGKTWYRVNVGKYDSREQADKMAELLRTKENFPKAFAAR